MEAFVINLDERQDRWKSLENTFNFFSLERVEAIKNPKIGWLGCLQSHQLCLKKAMNKNLQTCLVLEDDCKINLKNQEIFISRWNLIKNWLDNNLDKWDVFMGGCANVKPSDVYGIVNGWDDFSLVRLEYSTSTHFVYYNKSIYKKIINYHQHHLNLKGGYFPIDNIIAEKARGRIITSFPFIAIQTLGFSNLEKRIVDYSNLYAESEKNISKSIRTNGRKIISPILLGGLGNRLFQIASSYGIAKRQNKKVEIYNSHINLHSKNNYSDNIFRKVIFSHENLNDLKDSSHTLFQEPPNHFYSYLDIPNFDDKILFLLGYFQREEYFEDIKEEIIELFEMEEERYEKLISLYPDIKERYFIHVRRGDYTNNPLHEIDFYQPNGYYDYIINWINQRDKDSKFYLFSDDLKFCNEQKYFQSSKIDYIHNSEVLDEVDELYLMSLCEKGGIGCNSTFSWWGGYLNKNPNKIVFYSSKWLNNTDLNPIWKGSYFGKINTN